MYIFFLLAYYGNPNPFPIVVLIKLYNAKSWLSETRLFVKNAKEVGAIGVEIPFVDNSSIKSETEKQEFIDVMQGAFNLAKDLDMKISLETDLPPIAFKELLEDIDLDYILEEVQQHLKKWVI